MITCEFISIDDEDPDLVVAFSCAKEVYDQENDIIIQRTPKFESMLPESERGAHVSVGYDSDEVNVLESVEINDREVTIKAGEIQEKRDCRKVDKFEWKQLKKLLKRINFDKSFEVKIT